MSPLIIGALIAVCGGISITVCSITKARARKALETERRTLDAILQSSHVIADFSANGTALSEAIRTVVSATDADAGYIMLVDRENPTRLLTEAVYSFDDSDTLPTEARIGEGLIGTVAQSGQLAHFVRTNKTQELFEELPTQTQAAVCVPIRNKLFSDQSLSNADIAGVLVLVSKMDRKTFTGDRLEAINALGALLSMAVSSHWVGVHHRKVLMETLVVISSTLESRDKYMTGRSQRLCDLAMLLGRKFGMPHDALEELRLGMLLQDIGSVKVPDAILHKTGKLTQEEFELLKQHTTFGYELCRRLMISKGVATIVRNHHEKLDGTGYPDGLRGDQMPLALRIAAVCIAFDAMASPRAFRTALDLEEILQQLNLGVGTQFDAVVVQALRDAVEEADFRRIYPSLKRRGYSPRLEVAA